MIACRNKPQTNLYLFFFNVYTVTPSTINSTPCRYRQTINKLQWACKVAAAKIIVSTFEANRFFLRGWTENNKNKSNSFILACDPPAPQNTKWSINYKFDITMLLSKIYFSKLPIPKTNLSNKIKSCGISSKLYSYFVSPNIPAINLMIKYKNIFSIAFLVYFENIILICDDRFVLYCAAFVAKLS